MRWARLGLCVLCTGAAFPWPTLELLVPAAVGGALLAAEGCKPSGRALGEAEARALACDIANRHLAGKTFPTVSGAPYTPPVIAPSFWLKVEKISGRWRLSHDPPSGFFLAISFAEDGSNPVVERAGYGDV